MQNTLRKNISQKEYSLVGLLGLPLKEALNILGEPSHTYSFKDREVVSFPRGIVDSIFCEVANGHIISINSQKERRNAARISPHFPTKAFLRFNDHNITSDVIDISVKGVALKIPDGNPPREGQQVKLCTSILTYTRQKTYLSLFGYVHRTDPDNQSIVVLFSEKFSTHSHKLLRDYVNSQQALNSICDKIDTTSLAVAGQQNSLFITMSDTCINCETKSCDVETL